MIRRCDFCGGLGDLEESHHSICQARSLRAENVALRAQLEKVRAETWAECREAIARAVDAWHIKKGGYSEMAFQIRALRPPEPVAVEAKPSQPDASGATCAHDATDWACTRRKGCFWRGDKSQVTADLTCPKCGADAFAVASDWGSVPEDQPPPCPRDECGKARAGSTGGG